MRRVFSRIVLLDISYKAVLSTIKNSNLSKKLEESNIITGRSVQK